MPRMLVAPLNQIALNKLNLMSTNIILLFWCYVVVMMLSETICSLDLSLLSIWARFSQQSPQGKWLDKKKNNKWPCILTSSLKQTQVHLTFFFFWISALLLTLSALLWVTSYLKGSHQFISIQNYKSTAAVTCGVHQGSVLGPLLFKFYICPRSSGHDNQIYISYTTHRPLIFFLHFPSSLFLLFVSIVFVVKIAL